MCNSRYPKRVQTCEGLDSENVQQMYKQFGVCCFSGNRASRLQTVCRKRAKVSFFEQGMVHVLRHLFEFEL